MVGAAVLSPINTASQEAVVGSAQRVVVTRARATRAAAVQHCLEYLGSWHTDFELEGSARSVVQVENVFPEAAPCVAYARVDLDGNVGIVVDVPPEVCKLIRLIVHLTGYLYAEDGGGLRHPLRGYTHDLSHGPQYSEAERRAHYHDRARFLHHLLEQLQDDSFIVSVKHAPQRCCEGWLSGGCFPPPPRPRFFLINVYQSVHGVFARLEILVDRVHNRRENDVGQEGRKHAALTTKTRFHSEPPRRRAARLIVCHHIFTDDCDHVLCTPKRASVRIYILNVDGLLG